MTTPQIYVACLAAYNNGYLHGKWIDVTDEETIMGEINEMLKASPEPDAEEWDIHDYEGLGTYGDELGLEQCIERAEFIKEHGDLGEALIGECSGDMEYAANLMDNYQGEFDSEIDFAYHIVEECYTLEGPLSYYFDYEAFARDLFLDGYRSVYINGKYHVFSEH